MLEAAPALGLSFWIGFGELDFDWEDGVYKPTTGDEFNGVVRGLLSILTASLFRVLAVIGEVRDLMGGGDGTP